MFSFSTSAQKIEAKIETNGDEQIIVNGHETKVRQINHSGLHSNTYPQINETISTLHMIIQVQSKRICDWYVYLIVEETNNNYDCTSTCIDGTIGPTASSSHNQFVVKLPPLCQYFLSLSICCDPAGYGMANQYLLSLQISHDMTVPPLGYACSQSQNLEPGPPAP